MAPSRPAHVDPAHVGPAPARPAPARPAPARSAQPLYIHSAGLGPRQWAATQAALGGHAPALVGYDAPWPGDAKFHWRDELPRLLPHATPATDVVGHSYGGFLALQLAREVQVRSVVVWEPVVLAILGAPPEQTAKLLDDSAPLTRWMADFLGFWRSDWSAMSPAQRAPFLAHGAKVRAEVRALLEDHTPPEAFASITAPVCLVSGGAAVPMATAICARLASALPNATHRVVAGAGHMGPITHRAAWHALLRDFWDTLPA